MKRIFAALLALMLLALTPALADVGGTATPADKSLLEASQMVRSPEALPEVSMTPFAPDSLDKAIIGTDDRITISNTGVYPYSAIAYLEVTGSCGCNWTATGFMVSRDCLMTGAHCVFCGDHNQGASNFIMYFGYKSNKNYMLKYTDETNYWYGTNVYENGEFNTDWDFAFIKLRQPVGDKTGWFGLSVQDDAQLRGASFEVAGYRDGLLKTSRAGTTSIRSQYNITYDNDTLSGNSGCPVFTDDYYAVAINVAHVTNSNDVGLYNIGRRITQDLVNEMTRLGMFD